MILGVGHDLVDARRVAGVLARFGQRFLDRVFTADEQAYARTKADPVPVLARRFAAKEACAKALGTGLGQAAAFREIEVIRTDRGQPALALAGRAAVRLAALTPPGSIPVLHVSLSDDWPFASAFVIIEARNA